MAEVHTRALGRGLGHDQLRGVEAGELGKGLALAAPQQARAQDGRVVVGHGA